MPKRNITFGKLMKTRRSALKMTQGQFADLMHVTRNTVINWEADKSKPDYSLIPDICEILGIRLFEIFNMKAGPDLTDAERRIVKNFRRLSPTSRRVFDKLLSTMLEEELIAKDKAMRSKFRIYEERPGSLAAGTGDYVPEIPPKYVFLRKNSINEEADGIAKVNGDSMEPVYHSGDYVYYEKAKTARPGEDVLVDTDDGAVIKRLSNDYTLYSVNPDYPYPKKSEDNTLIIRGRVLGVVQPSDRPTAEENKTLEVLFEDEVRAYNNRI